MTNKQTLDMTEMIELLSIKYYNFKNLVLKAPLLTENDT